MTLSNLGTRIRQRRKLLGMTQSDLASALGISFQQIQKYETGVGAISDARLRQICDAMSLPHDYFADPRSNYIGEAVTERKDFGLADALSSEQTRFVMSREGRRLIDAFVRIVDPQLRTRVLDFVHSLGADRPVEPDVKPSEPSDSRPTVQTAAPRRHR